MTDLQFMSWLAERLVHKYGELLSMSGPWRAEKHDGLWRVVRGSTDRSLFDHHDLQGRGIGPQIPAHKFTEAEAIAVRDALNRVATDAAFEEQRKVEQEEA